MGPSEIYSTVSLVRLLKMVEYKKKCLNVIQMTPKQFFDYKQCATEASFSKIPYTQLRHLKFDSQKPYEIRFRLSFKGDEEEVDCLAEATSAKRKSTRKTKKAQPRYKNNLDIIRENKMKKMFQVKSIQSKPGLSLEKCKDIKAMLKFMPMQDKTYMQLLCNQNRK